MAVDGHHARAVAARRVVAEEPAVVVARGVEPDRVLELRDDAQCRQRFPACGRGAVNTFGGDAGEGGGQAEEGEGVFAVPAAEGEGRAVFEADRVWDLGFERRDLGCLGRC